MFEDKGLPYNAVHLDEGKIPLDIHGENLYDRGISTAHFDPTNIRSQFARFDPRLEHLSHLSASTGGAMELARAATAKQRAGGQIAPSKYLPGVPRQVAGAYGDGGITAYHGSPHSFDRFDISKLGTGEGAQAYGHGLYFAGNEKIAKHYRDTLSNRSPKHISDFLQRSGLSPDVSNAYSDFAASTYGGKGSLDDFKKILDQEHPSPAITNWRKNALNEISKLNDATSRLGGHMYKVKLHVGPHELLDWDKPLSEQHPNIQRAAREADISKAVGPTRGVLQAWREGRDVGVEATGQDLHKALSGYGEHGKGAADYLLSHGIKGIRYLDAGSRGDTENPTHNYVMFHHDPVEVEERYKKGGLVNAALAMTAKKKGK